MLIASILCNRFNDFDDDGGPAADELAPKVAILHRFLTSKFGHGVPRIDVSLIVFILDYLQN